jgi:transposase-like protein
VNIFRVLIVEGVIYKRTDTVRIIPKRHCKDCSKNFQQTYRYNARKKGVKEQIEILTPNRCVVRDISRILQINKNTVVSELKKNDKHKPLCIGQD